MATLARAISDLVTTLQAVEGVRAAPEAPPETIEVYPFVAVYPGRGRSEFGVPGERLELDDIIVELHVARKDLARDVTTALPFVDSIPDAIMFEMKDNKWSSTIDTFEAIEWTFGSLGWAGIETIGFRFTVIGVKRRITY